MGAAADRPEDLRAHGCSQSTSGGYTAAPHGLVKVKNVMSAETWSTPIHPDENRYISPIFGG